MTLDHLQRRVSMGIRNRRLIGSNELGLHKISRRMTYSIALEHVLNHLQLLRSLLLHELLHLLGSTEGTGEVFIKNIGPSIQHHVNLNKRLLIGILRQIPTDQPSFSSLHSVDMIQNSQGLHHMESVHLHHRDLTKRKAARLQTLRLLLGPVLHTLERVGNAGKIQRQLDRLSTTSTREVVNKSRHIQKR